MSGEVDRSILHIDCNGFFASVECLDHPEYWKLPLAVAGDPKDRSGIILAKNELAKKYGVITTETIQSAKRKCPGLVLVPPRMERYREISRQVNRIYLQYTDQVEPFSIDESFLDLSGSLALFRATARELADRIREQVRREVGITVSVGVSFNKTFAKIGSDMKKPDATTEITRENYRALVWNLPLKDMLFVGRASLAECQKLCINTIGDLALKSKSEVIRLLGKAGEQLWNNANGLDTDPVRTYGDWEPVKSVSNGMTFRRDLVTLEEITAGVLALTDEITTRLRQINMKCRTIQVSIKNPMLKVISRQASLQPPTNLHREAADVALELIRAHWHFKGNNECDPIRAITVAASNLVKAEEACEQLSLFDLADQPSQAASPPYRGAGREKMERLEAAMDQIRKKHGTSSIAMGLVTSEELGIKQFGKKQ